MEETIDAVTEARMKYDEKVNGVIQGLLAGVGDKDDAFQLLMLTAESCFSTAASVMSDEDFDNAFMVMKTNVTRHRKLMVDMRAYAAEKDVNPTMFIQAIGFVSKMLISGGAPDKEKEVELQIFENVKVNLFHEEGNWQGLLIIDDNYEKPVNMNLKEFIPAVA